MRGSGQIEHVQHVKTIRLGNGGFKAHPVICLGGLKESTVKVVQFCLTMVSKL